MNLNTKELQTFISSGSDYDLSIQFYLGIGFELLWKNESISCFGIGNCKFFLQNYPNDWMKGNFMMALEVESVDDWWEHLSKLDLETKYPGVKLKAPENYSWGKREIHLGDINGVLWHFSNDIPS